MTGFNNLFCILCGVCVHFTDINGHWSNQDFLHLHQAVKIYQKKAGIPDNRAVTFFKSKVTDFLARTLHHIEPSPTMPPPFMVPFMPFLTHTAEGLQCNTGNCCWTSSSKDSWRSHCSTSHKNLGNNLADNHAFEEKTYITCTIQRIFTTGYGSSWFQVHRDLTNTIPDSDYHRWYTQNQIKKVASHTKDPTPAVGGHDIEPFHLRSGWLAVIHDNSNSIPQLKSMVSLSRFQRHPHCLQWIGQNYLKSISSSVENIHPAVLKRLQKWKGNG